MVRRVLQSLSRNWNDPDWLSSVIYNLTVRRPSHVLMKRYFEYKDVPGDDFMAEDWDNLIILDACRYDMFEQTSTLPGTLEKRTAPGSATPEFLRETFLGKQFYDTVYVTANPMYRDVGLEDVFHAVVDVWQEGWDDDLRTVRPSTMAEAALEAYETYPNKRIIAHFMQPHYPFIGERARAEIGDHAGYEYTRKHVLGGEQEHDQATVWQLLDSGEISKELAWETYVENLEVALPHVAELVDQFEGLTVVTSDHGNLLDEPVKPFPFRVSGHPVGIHTEQLVTVPWLRTENGPRKDLLWEQPVEDADESTAEREVVTQRLEDLGYVG